MDCPTTTPYHSCAADVLVALSTVGLALIDVEPTPLALTELAHELGARIVPHPDGDAAGVTVIEDRGARDAALAGFTREALSLHTDRSGVAEPPDLLMTTCAMESTSGGEVLLADSRAVYLDLAECAPAALAALTEPRSTLFGGASGHLGAVFTSHGDTTAVRLRLDSLARFSPAAAPYVATLRAAIDRHTITIPSRAGAGYVLDNRRWLHGRRSYTGTRRLYRVTAMARAGSIRRGFTRDAADDAAIVRDGAW